MLKNNVSRGEIFLTQSLPLLPSSQLRKITPDTTKNNQTKEIEIEKGLDFILLHFDLIIFPRTISTFQSQNKQIIVRDKEEILKKYGESNFIDCRINAFPSLKEGVIWASDFIFIDLDIADFKNERSLDLALTKTLKNIKERLEGHPTVLWTGGGYHIYLPIEGIEFERYEAFNDFSDYNLFNGFMRIAKKFLSFDKADKINNPSLKSCLLRIPGSINSKYQTKVKIIQKWNGIRPHVNLLIGNFFACLVDHKIKREKEFSKTKHFQNKNQTNSNTIPWIEKLLQTPIEDGRKYVLWKVLCPYLINVRKLENEQSFNILKIWLKKCNNLRRLDFNPTTEINSKLKNVKYYNPISIKILEHDNRDLYLLLKKS